MKKKIYLSLVLITILSIGLIFAILNYPYSKGVRNGKLVKISQKGVIVKTYEGTLDLGSGDQLTWQFSVHDQKLGEKLVALTGKNVKLEYRELLFKLFYDTKYDVLGVERTTSFSENGDSFCRFVNILRQKRSVVNIIREMVEKSDPDLLEEIRRCQQ